MPRGTLILHKPLPISGPKHHYKMFVLPAKYSNWLMILNSTSYHMLRGTRTRVRSNIGHLRSASSTGMPPPKPEKQVGLIPTGLLQVCPW